MKCQVACHEVLSGGGRAAVATAQLWTRRRRRIIRNGRLLSLATRRPTASRHTGSLGRHGRLEIWATDSENPSPAARGRPGPRQDRALMILSSCRSRVCEHLLANLTVEVTRAAGPWQLDSWTQAELTRMILYDYLNDSLRLTRPGPGPGTLQPLSLWAPLS